MTRFLAALLVLALSPAMAAERMTIGYVDRADDPRHEDRMGFGGILLEQRGRAIDGAKLALEDLAAVGRSLNIEIDLAEARAENADAVAGEVEKLRRERNAQFIVVDAPAKALIAVRAHPRRDTVQCRGGRRCVTRRRLPGANHARDSEPRDAHRCADSVRRRPQVARHPGARRPRCTRRGRGARARALGQALRRADRGKTAVRAGQRSARARPEQSGAADRGAGL